jgi:serine/threonine protein kinase
MAPEMFTGVEYDPYKSDIFAFAMLIWELITLRK